MPHTFNARHHPTPNQSPTLTHTPPLQRRLLTLIRQPVQLMLQRNHLSRQALSAAQLPAEALRLDLQAVEQVACSSAWGL